MRQRKLQHEVVPFFMHVQGLIKMHQRENGCTFPAGKFRYTSEVCPLYVGRYPHLVGARPENMSPVYVALSLFGFSLGLMPHVSSAWQWGGQGRGFTVTGARTLINLNN